MFTVKGVGHVLVSKVDCMLVTSKELLRCKIKVSSHQIYTTTVIEIYDCPTNINTP